MPNQASLAAGRSLRIPAAELSYRATRAGGPGGQHVNTSSTRVELWWNLTESAAPTPPQRATLLARLANRLDGEGWLRLVEAGSRSQLRNREEVTARFLRLLEEALRPKKKRQPTRVPRVEKKKRLETKRQRGEVKRLRGRIRSED
ncbi:MAG: aminoacyl-tRNA hydrolase [Gemmatimonadales bacterium]|nr:aminoacyl-tRNA hydrolase [Gemmatimonadales bacterium]